MGIDRLFFHEGIGYKYNLIQPVTLNISITDASELPEPLPPHVQPPYYSAIILSEVLGSISNVRIAEFDVESDIIAGYALYDEDGRLARAILINSLAFTEGDGEERPVVHLTFDTEGPLRALVKRLAIE